MQTIEVQEGWSITEFWLCIMSWHQWYWFCNHWWKFSKLNFTFLETLSYANYVNFRWIPFCTIMVYSIGVVYTPFNIFSVCFAAKSETFLIFYESRRGKRLSVNYSVFFFQMHGESRFWCRQWFSSMRLLIGLVHNASCLFFLPFSK